MPNRIIKETIRTSKSVNSLTDFQFRVWTYLITYVDDYGRGSADPELLRGLVFPRRKTVTEKQIREALSALAKADMIILYEDDGESYFYFPNWGKHQRIQTKKSKFPEPPEITENHGESPQAAEDCGEFPPESNPIQSESNTESESESNTESNPKRGRADAFAEFCGEDKELLQALRDFEDMRNKIKKPLTEKAKTMLLSKLQTFPQDQWIEIVNQSVFHSWQGIFPLERDAPPRGSGKKKILTAMDV